MSIAVFKPIQAALDEGETVWGKLKQKVVEEAELAAHTDAGWFTDANEALVAHDVAATEAENAALQAQIDAATVKLGRKKAANAAPTPETPAPDPATPPSQL